MKLPGGENVQPRYDQLRRQSSHGHCERQRRPQSLGGRVPGGVFKNHFVVNLQILAKLHFRRIIGSGSMVTSEANVPSLRPVTGPQV